ncbi:MAG: hypothetical protein KTR31_25255 [Myxococcales bacterium]|nr:hypothetical protein [Myxococcales bacterium]
MWIWMLAAAFAQPLEPADAAPIEVTILADKEGTEVVPFDTLRELRKGDAACTAPCTLELSPGRHRVGTRRGRRLALTRLNLKPGADPVTLRSKRTKVWALVTYGVLQGAAGLAVASAAVPDNCHFYDPGGVLESPSAAASCRSRTASRQTSAFATAATLTASAMPFLIISMPRLKRVRQPVD